MFEGEIAAWLTQFGMAGLIAWMWLTERRAGSAREAQLNEAHKVVIEQRVQIDALMRLISENTRAISALELSQRTIGQLLDRIIGGDERAARRTSSGTLGG